MSNYEKKKKQNREQCQCRWNGAGVNMLTAIRRFIWPSKEDIKGFNRLKWYQGFNFWYFTFAVVCLLIIDACSTVYIEKIYNHKIPSIRYILNDAFFALGIYYMFFLYLLYRRHFFAYILAGLWYYVFYYSIASHNQYFVPEEVWFHIALYVLGFFAARISWHYRWFYPTSNDELKKDFIVGLLLVEACFYLPSQIFNPYKELLEAGQ